MQLASLAAGLAVLMAGAALAAQGDALLVTGSNVNVRAGPSTEAGILGRVGVDERAIERRRQGQWVEVELPGQNVLGWIHDSLLARAPDQAGPAFSESGQAQGEQRQPPRAAGEVASLDEGTGAARATEIAATDAVGTEEPDDSPLGRFRRDVAYFNERAVAAAGVDLFTGVAPLGESGVQVVATEAWATMSQPGQQSYLNALFGRWQAAAGAAQALHLQIVDPSGALMMEKSGP
jgi:Bacterial SH3 domain